MRRGQDHAAALGASPSTAVRSKPELLLAALTLADVFLVPGTWPWVKGLQSVSVQGRALRNKWHTDQTVYDKTRPVAIPKFSLSLDPIPLLRPLGQRLLK